MAKYYCEVEIFRQENVGNENYTTEMKIDEAKKKYFKLIQFVNEVIGDADYRSNSEITYFTIKLKKVNPKKKGFKKLTVRGDWRDTSIYKL